MKIILSRTFAILFVVLLSFSSLTILNVKQVLSYLSKFAKENNIILFVTENGNPRNKKLHELTIQKADTVISINHSKYEHEFNLEKHPTYILGTADFPSENLEITHFSQSTQPTLKAFSK